MMHFVPWDLIIAVCVAGEESSSRSYQSAATFLPQLQKFHITYLPWRCGTFCWTDTEHSISPRMPPSHRILIYSPFAGAITRPVSRDDWSSTRHLWIATHRLLNFEQQSFVCFDSKVALHIKGDHLLCEAGAHFPTRLCSRGSLFPPQHPHHC